MARGGELRFLGSGLDTPGVKAGDVATVYGPGLTDWAAQLAGTIPYELLCQLTPRVPRLYLEQGSAIS